MSRCFICDKELKTEEIIWNELAQEWEPCPECLLIISEVFKDGLDEEQITWLLEEEWYLPHGELSWYKDQPLTPDLTTEDQISLDNSS
jgi:hypothetical protein